MNMDTRTCRENVVTIQDCEEIYIVNLAVHAMRKLQEAMKGAAETAGWESEEDVVAYVKELRAEMAEERAAKKNESLHRYQHSDFVHSMA